MAGMFGPGEALAILLASGHRLPVKPTVKEPEIDVPGDDEVCSECGAPMLQTRFGVFCPDLGCIANTTSAWLSM